MARFTVVLPDSVAVWVKASAKKENVSQSAFVANMLSYAMAGIDRDIRILDLESPDIDCYTLPNGECVVPTCRLHGSSNG